MAFNKETRLLASEANGAGRFFVLTDGLSAKVQR